METEPSGIPSTNSGSTRSGATSNRRTLCYCERPACIITAYTDRNFGRRFMKCENYKINRACGFWEWVDPKMCEHGRRVVDHLRQKHISLLEESERCRTMLETEVERVKEKLDIEATERCRAIVEAEVGKMKSKMELDNYALRKEIEIGTINYQSMKKNYRTIIACTWILIIFYLAMIWRTSNGEVKHNHMLFP